MKEMIIVTSLPGGRREKGQGRRDGFDPSLARLRRNRAFTEQAMMGKLYWFADNE